MNKKAYLFFSLIVLPLFSANSLNLKSRSFSHNGHIPSKYTGDGDNISPHLAWTNPPRGTKSFVLIVDDPDAEEKSFTHWLIFNISAAISELSEGTERGDFISGVTDFYYAKNGSWVYCGPFPPEGTHHYHFTLYALDTKLNLSEKAERPDVERVMRGHILEKATLIGLYERR